MNILIVGCGRMGSSLAAILSREGHDISIVDDNEHNFSLLPEDFDGFFTAGFPTDSDILRRAGIENCDAVAAVSPDDNVNIMVSQLAKKIFGIKTVVARINDPAREQIFSQFGLDTICPTNIAVDSVRSALLRNPSAQLHFGTGSVAFRTVPVPDRLLGAHTDNIVEPDGEEVFAVRRDGRTLLTGQQDVILSEGDQLIIAKISD